MAARISDALRVPPGPIDLRAIDPRATPEFSRDKAAARRAQEKLAPRLADLQERLFAEGRTGGRRRVLLVLQGLDTSGKGGALRHVVGQMDPQGVQITAFGPPTAEERRHDFLWRIRRRLPSPGRVGVFDRSHYEDVVTVRVNNLVPRATWSRRYSAINRFEKRLVVDGTRVVKCFLHISMDEFCRRQRARLDDTTKHWKFDPADLEDVGLWDDYLDAYGDALERCNTGVAPWYVVPADRKWYRNWALTRLLIEQLEAMDLGWPSATFDVDEQRARLSSLCQSPYEPIASSISTMAPNSPAATATAATSPVGKSPW
jgi:PPK2 family polyphosphate:nucleotide phosphotransferase